MLLYQLATASAAGRSFNIADMNVPLHLSDVHYYGANATSSLEGLERLDQVLSHQQDFFHEILMCLKDLNLIYMQCFLRIRLYNLGKNV